MCPSQKSSPSLTAWKSDSDDLLAAPTASSVKHTLANFEKMLRKTRCRRRALKNSRRPNCLKLPREVQYARRSASARTHTVCEMNCANCELNLTDNDHTKADTQSWHCDHTRPNCDDPPPSRADIRHLKGKTATMKRTMKHTHSTSV